MKKLLVFTILFAALFLGAGYACGEQTVAAPPAPKFFRGGGPAALFGDGQHLYVLAGGKLLEYKLPEMTLEHSLDLPVCPPPGVQRMTKAQEPREPMLPPPPPPPHGLWGANGKLYVLAGPAIYVYKTDGLTLANTVKLPWPKPPQAGK